MARHNWFLHSKGGIGKSMLANFCAQYLKQKIDSQCHCYDIDASNQTFASFKDLDVEAIDVRSGDDVDPRKFDQLMERLIPMGAEDHTIIDSGASSYIPLVSYLKESAVFDMLTEQGHEIYIHTIITGGQDLLETISGFANLLVNFPNIPVVLWLNPYFGDISVDGKLFTDFNIYQDNAEHIHAIINLPYRNSATFGKDMEQLLAKKYTFQAGINSSAPLMTKQRLHTMWKELCGVLDQAQLY